MKSAVKLAVVMLAVFGVSVVLTPILAPILPMFKFEKIFNRLIMVFTISAAVLAVMKAKVSPQQYGFDFSVPWKRLAVYGFLGGFLFVATVTVVEVLWGPRYLREDTVIFDILQRFGKGMLSGVIVGIVEEFFFRAASRCSIPSTSIRDSQESSSLKINRRSHANSIMIMPYS